MRGHLSKTPTHKVLISSAPRQVSFFLMFWVNEQPPSRVSAMALRHNVQSQQRQACNVSRRVYHKMEGHQAANFAEGSNLASTN